MQSTRIVLSKATGIMNTPGSDSYISGITKGIDFVASINIISVFLRDWSSSSDLNVASSKNGSDSILFNEGSSAVVHA